MAIFSPPKLPRGPLIGRILAHYEIQSELGRGGMGEVYLARDTKLARDVALKVIPEVFVRDSQRLHRFAREAKMLAALNHPNIAAVYGLEEDGERIALVMELVQGETLAERIDRGRIPFEEVARIAVELARAVEYAHEKGIVHRDLKPANVMLDAEGHVKVLDFGLAKALEEEQTPEELANSPTLTAAATQAGIILGTAAYMSPEQAAGTTVDRRADIWSYGAVLSEMLSGRAQFRGETVSHTLAAVLKDDPDWEQFPSDVPPRILELLRRCLEKDPRRRLQSIGEARVLWESYLADPESFQGPGETATNPITRGSTVRRILPWSIAALAIAAAGFFYFGGRTGASPAVTPQRFTIRVDGITDFIADQTSPPAISPDGRLIAYGMTDDEGVYGLWIRPIDDFEAHPLAGTSGARFVFWAPDGRHLGFFQGGRLRRVEVSTGRSQSIGPEKAFFARGASWTSKGQILFSPNTNSGIWAIDADGGVARQVTQLDPEIADASHRWPCALPDGEHFLFLMWSNDADALVEHGGVYVGSVDGSTKPRRIVTDASRPVYSQSGHLLVIQERSLVAIPFDADEQEVTGEGFVVADGVLMNRNNGYAAFSESDNGTLVFARGLGSIPNSSFFWSDRRGELQDTPVGPGVIFRDLRLSPDAMRAVTTSPGPSGDPEVWILDLVRGVRSRLTPSAPYTFDRPVWSPSGDRVVYSCAKSGTWDLYVRHADGSGREEVLIESPVDKIAMDWKGDRILYWRDNVESGGSSICTYDVSTGESVIVLEYPGNPEASFSPDGQYMIYDATESGRSQVIVQQIEGGARWQVSTDGGRLAHWSDDGSEIVYLDPHRRVMAVDVVHEDSGLRLGHPQELFQIVQNVIAWDVTGDHQRFLLATRPELESEPLYVVLNWNGS